MRDCRTLAAGRCPKPARGDGYSCKYYNPKYLCYYIDYKEFTRLSLGEDGVEGEEGE